MVCVSRLELGFTDAVVNFGSVILFFDVTFAQYKMLLLRHLLFKGCLDLFIQLHVLA